MADRGGEFSFFQDIHVRNDIRSDISISITHITTTFGKQAHLQHLTHLTNQACGGDVITSISLDKLKAIYFQYQSVYCHQTWQDGNLP